jgi:lipopolysaccharide transport system ATP-binding protein
VSRFEAGRIEAVDLGRHFKIASGGGRSLKATLLRRDVRTMHEFWALRHANVQIEPGETFGVVGRNGSGKSTFLKMLARIYGPSEGHCRVGGRMSSLIELGAGFHQEFNAIENIFLAGAVYGIPKRELERDLDDIIDFAELDAFAYQPIKTYSSGMYMRLGFSVAMHVRPDVLLLDEVLAVGDERFIQKCLARIAKFRREGGTMLLVTHDAGTVRRLCSRAMLLERGETIMLGSADEVITAYHERLANADNSDDHAAPRAFRHQYFEADVVVLNAKEEPHHQFVEGESLSIRLLLTPETSLPNTLLTVSFTDELGRELGSRTTGPLAFERGRLATVDLEFPRPVFREGLIQLDVLAVDALAGTELLRLEKVETLSIYGSEPASGGPIQLGGDWSVR